MNSRTAFIVALLLWTASVTSAQQGPAHEAVLELKVDAAEVIVRGTVMAVQRHEAGQLQKVTVTLKVLETIKGAPLNTLEFSESETNEYSIFKETYFNNWRTGGYEFLWFFRRTSPGPTGPSAFTPFLDYLGGKAQIPLARDIRPLTPKGYAPLFPDAYVTTELKVLKSPEELLAAVRAAASYKTRRANECPPPQSSVVRDAPGCSVGIPPRMIVWPGDGYVQYLRMPLDERMEKLCRRMIQRPEEIWSIPPANPSGQYEVPDDEKIPLVREQGVLCLRAFRSEENIALLKSVLNEGTALSSRTNSRKRFDEKRAASETLTSWGISVQ